MDSGKNKSSKQNNSVNSELYDSVMRLQRNLKRCSEIVQPNSYGRGQGRLLQFISDYDGITAQQLANLMDIRPSSLTSRLRSLQQDGNIIKTRDEHDARIIHIHITEKGKAALSQRKSAKQTVAADFCDCLSPEEQKLFIEMCNRLSENLADIKEKDTQRKRELIKKIIS